jgi:hypothetical protein
MPFVAIGQDMTRRCQQLNIGCNVMDNATADIDPHKYRLVFCTYESLGTNYPKYRSLVEDGTIKRVVFDECHCLVTQLDFRRGPKSMPQFIEAVSGAQLIFMTATLPLYTWPAFRKSIGSKITDAPTTAIIRAKSTTRPEIVYIVQQATLLPKRFPTQRDVYSSLRDVQYWIEGHHQDSFQTHLESDPTSRAIIYVPRKDMIDEIGDALWSFTNKIGVYTSIDMLDNGKTDERQEMERAKTLDRWINGHFQIMIATTAFGAGVDYGRVSHVIHYCYVYSFIDFIQGSGRAGRDGKKAFSIFLCAKGQTNMVPHSGLFQMGGIYGEMKKRDQEMAILYATKHQCRRELISEAMDQTTTDCMTGSNELCDVCWNKYGGWLQEEEQLPVTTLPPEPDANVINPATLMQSETDSNLYSVLLAIRKPGAPLETNDYGFVCFCCLWHTNNPLIRNDHEFDERKFTNTIRMFYPHISESVVKQTLKELDRSMFGYSTKFAQSHDQCLGCRFCFKSTMGKRHPRMYKMDSQQCPFYMTINQGVALLYFGYLAKQQDDFTYMEQDKRAPTLGAALEKAMEKLDGWVANGTRWTNFREWLNIFNNMVAGSNDLPAASAAMFLIYHLMTRDFFQRPYLKRSMPIHSDSSKRIKIETTTL